MAIDSKEGRRPLPPADSPVVVPPHQLLARRAGYLSQRAPEQEELQLSSPTESKGNHVRRGKRRLPQGLDGLCQQRGNAALEVRPVERDRQSNQVILASAAVTGGGTTAECKCRTCSHRTGRRRSPPHSKSCWDTRNHPLLIHDDLANRLVLCSSRSFDACRAGALPVCMRKGTSSLEPAGAQRAAVSAKPARVHRLVRAEESQVLGRAHARLGGLGRHMARRTVALRCSDRPRLYRVPFGRMPRLDTAQRRCPADQDLHR